MCEGASRENILGVKVPSEKHILGRCVDGVFHVVSHA